MGIYQIKNKRNGKVLVGSSINLLSTLNRFKAELKLGSHRNKVLQKEWQQFGPEMFEFEELERLGLSRQRDIEGVLQRHEGLRHFKAGRFYVPQHRTIDRRRLVPEQLLAFAP